MSDPTPLTSISQVNLWGECQRKWALKYIGGIETPQNAAAALGTELDDDQLQPYLRDGREFDYTKESGYLAAAGLAYLPKPATQGGPNLEVQKRIELPAASSTPGQNAPFGYQGYIDLWLPEGGMPNLPVIGPAVPCVTDFKSSGDLSKPWIKTPETLLTDPQATLYSTWAMYSTGARAVDLVWLYFQTRNARRVKRVHLRIFPDRGEYDGKIIESDLVERFKAIDAKAAEIIAAAKSAADPMTFPPNPEACEAFGGCPHRARCNLDPVLIAEAMAAKSTREQSTKAHRANKKRNDEGMTTATSTADLFANLMQSQAAATGAPAPTITTAPGSALMGCSDKDVPTPTTIPAWAQGGPPPVGVNPPETKLAPAPPIGQVATSATPPAAAATAPAKRGRKSKAEKEALEAAAQATAQAALAATSPHSGEKVASPSSSPPFDHRSIGAGGNDDKEEKKIGTLFLDCYPIGKDTTQAEELYETAACLIQAEHGVPDFRLIDYGKGAGVFASTLARVVDGAGSWGDVCLDTSTPEGSIAKSVLVFRASRVVKGAR